MVGAVVLPSEVTQTPPNPTAKASAAAPPTIVIVFFVPVILLSSHFNQIDHRYAMHLYIYFNAGGLAEHAPV